MNTTLSDNEIKILAFILWPLILCVAIFVFVLVWPFIPFCKVVRKDGKIILEGWMI